MDEKYELCTDFITSEYLKHNDINKPVKIPDKLKYFIQENQRLKSQLQYTQALFDIVVNSTQTLIRIIDAKGNYTFLNQSWLSFTAQTLNEGLKEEWRDRIHPQDLDRCEKVYNNAIKQCRGFEIEYRLRRFDNTYRIVLDAAVRQHNSKGEFAGLLCSCVDITQRKKIEQELVKQAHIDRILAEIAQDIHSSLDLDLILQTATEQVNQYLLADQISITKITNNKHLTLLFTANSRNNYSRCNLNSFEYLPNQELLHNFKKLSQGEIVGSTNVSLTKTIETNYSDLPSEAYSFLLVPIIVNTKLWGLICIEQNLPPRCWELNEIKLLERVAIQLGVAIKQSEMYQELEQLAIIDSLTKVANRRKFDSYLAEEWKRLSREKSPLSLILCDIDYFKLYNDTYGHQAGDRCLRQVAQGICQVTKRPADLVARYGGEEFAIILPNTDLGGAKYLAQKIRLKIKALKIPHVNSKIDRYVTLSLGVCGSIPAHDLSFYALIAAADKGLYQAKELGRNRVVKFELDNL